MGINLGALAPAGVRLGEQAVRELRLGEALVWRADAGPGASSSFDLGDGQTLLLSEPRPYYEHEDGSVTIEWASGLEVLGWGGPDQTSAADADVRDGGMWNPGTANLRYDPVSAAFDGRMAGNGANSGYFDNLNVNPQRTGTAFAVPAPGTLVIGLSTTATVSPADYEGQRSNQAIERYRVVQFATTLPTSPRALRAPVRGSLAVRSGWDRDVIDANLDTIFPPTKDFSALWVMAGHLDSDLAEIENTASAGQSFATSWPSEPMAARRGMHFHGGGFGSVMGRCFLHLISSTAPLAKRRRIAYAMCQLGIDFGGIIEDGGYWQSNGNHTSGRMPVTLNAGVLLGDPYLQRAALDPMGGEIAPGVTIGYLPFSEQRCYNFVTATPRTTGTDPANGGQIASWGAYVGAGGGHMGGGKPASPDSVPIAAEELGQPLWQIAPDRLHGHESTSMHPLRNYRTDNMIAQIKTRVLYEHWVPGIDVSALAPFLASIDRASGM